MSQASRYQAFGAIWVACWIGLLTPWASTQAQEPQEDTAPETGWANTTDLGLSATDGNSQTGALNVFNLLRWRSDRADFKMKLEALRKDSADDRFRQVDPGFSWEVGAAPPELTTVLVEPDPEPDVEKYYVEARYERSTSKKTALRRGALSWHAGASWDRNLDAGLLGRWVFFSGVGNTWWDREDRPTGRGDRPRVRARCSPHACRGPWRRRPRVWRP